MTVIQRDVFDQLTSGARVFVLAASRSTLEARIARSSEGQAWRRSNLDRCLDVFDSNALGERIETDDLTPREIAHVILGRI